MVPKSTAKRLQSGGGAATVQATEMTHEVQRPEPWFTWANVATTIRVVAGTIIFTLAAYRQDETLNFVGLGVYWVLDIVDGLLARKLDQETQTGAQFDILSDRLLVAFFYFNYVTFHPDVLVPVVLFLFEFMLIDHFLSNQFLIYHLKSPNYFGDVHPLIYKINWSMAGKAINSGLVTVLLIVTKSPVLATIAISIIIATKLYSLALLHAFERQQGGSEDEAAA